MSILYAGVSELDSSLVYSSKDMRLIIGHFDVICLPHLVEICCVCHYIELIYVPFFCKEYIAYSMGK
jgi:hypothetical protein